MKKNRFLHPLLAVLFLSGNSYSQSVEKIKFKKDPSLIYFFQKGVKSDTLHKDSGWVFYLVVPDTLKKNLVLEVENGQLMPTANDSIVTLNYLPGFKYESFYSNKENEGLKHSKGEVYEFKTLVNGISVSTHTKISISLINKSTGGLILENVFFYFQQGR